MEKIKGGMLMAWVSGQTIAFATSHNLNIDANMVSNANKDEGGGDWDVQDVNTLAWTIDSENFYSMNNGGEGAEYVDLFDIMISKQPVALKFGKRTVPSGNTGDVPSGGWTLDNTSEWYEGDAIISSLHLTATNGEYSKYTVTFTGHGAITKKTT